MGTGKFELQKIGFTSAIATLILSVSLGAFVESRIMPGHGKITFFSSMMIILSVISSRSIFKNTGAAIFLFFYISIHIFVALINISWFEDLRSFLIAPLAMLDYTLFVFGIGFSFRENGRDS